ncbi:MAG: hypothetical protein GY822_11775 [Deltaproteobacteria bacterium]|nr:hypothetical protein [Deltaproteobacteria bacterium]
MGATVSDLKDVLGNKDGIWGNESAAPGTLGNGFDRNPLSERMQQALGVGFSVDDELKLLSDFKTDKEKQWGQPVSDLQAGDLKRRGALFLVQKTIQLTRMERGPATVKDAYVSAKGSFDGKPLQDRAIFTQRYLPTAEPSGQVVVLSPGFQETGRNFEKQIAAMNASGHEVVTLDHQWVGQSDGSPVGLDRGAGVARDVAAVAAYASEIAEKQYGDKGKVTLFGNSMGAGPGVLGALTLTAAKGADGKPRLELFDGDGKAKAMPENMGAVLQSPFLGTTKNALNATLAFASHLPFVNRLQIQRLACHNSPATAARRNGEHRAQFSRMYALK